MIPAATVVPCSSKVQSSIDANSLIQQGLISHPCDRKMKVIYKDDPPITACGITTTRTWTVSDNCNQVDIFQQLVKVLPIQKPLSPKDGEVNVGLTEALIWPKYPNSFKYHVYLWKNTERRKKVAEVSYNFYRPNGQQYYPPNSQILWQIEFQLRDGVLVNNQSIIPSPVWSYETMQITDFSIMTVNSPDTFFTGRTMQVSWTVKNKGSRGNYQPNWYDWVFLSRDIDMTGVRLLSKTVRMNRFIFPGDIYFGNTMISIPNDLFGIAYVHVITDYYNSLKEINRTNNHGVNLQPLLIKLTPPPDLQVDQVVVPQRTFSGKYIIRCIVLVIFALAVSEGQNICENNLNPNKHRNYFIVRKFRGKTCSRMKPIRKTLNFVGIYFPEWNQSIFLK